VPKPRSQRVERLIAGVIVGAVVGVVAAAAAVARPRVLERAEFWTYDSRARRAAEAREASPDVVILEITEQDLEDAENNFGVTWPWPRAMFGYLAQYAQRAGAKAIVYDWLFQDRGQYSVTDAEEFAAALRDNGRAVIGVAMTKRAQVARGTEGPWVARLGQYATWDEVQAVALKLLAWNTRSYVVPTRTPSGGEVGPYTLYYGGKRSADDVRTTWQRLMSAEELEPVFAEQVPPPPPGPDGAPPQGADAEPMPPSEPEPLELPADELARELTIETIMSRRDALALHAPGLRVPVRAGLDPPLAPIAAAPALAGNVYQDVEHDGVMRRYAPIVRRGDRLYPSLALAAWVVGNPDAELSADGQTLRLGELRVPLDGDGRFGIRFHGAGVYRHLRAFEVLRSLALLDEGQPPSIPLDELKDKYIIVSASVQALRDFLDTPMSHEQEGAEVQATALDNLLHGGFVVRVSRWLDAAIALLLCVLTAVAMVALWSVIARAALALLAVAAATAALIVGYWAFAAWRFDAASAWYGVATPALGVGVSAFAALLVTSAAERRGRRFVQEALGKYTSPALVKELMAHPEYLSLEWGESREMSVYFSDIAGFTSFSEKLAPEQLVALLNDYLTSMTDLVLQHGGVVDKYIGDAVMAFWGAPLPEPQHAQKAVLCALAMRRKCDELRVRWQAEYGTEVHARAGVNSGRAVVGNMGSKHKYNYTVMGDMVNLASRLEGANKPYGTYLMISEFTLDRLGPDLVDVRELDFLAVKGKAQPVRVFEVLEEKGRTDPATLRAVDRYLDGLRRYRDRDFSGAIAAFKAALKEKPDDSPSLMYIDRCRHFIDHPPEDGWDGVWRMQEK
jgi:adenylate cyclase